MFAALTNYLKNKECSLQNISDQIDIITDEKYDTQQHTIIFYAEKNNENSLIFNKFANDNNNFMLMYRDQCYFFFAPYEYIIDSAFKRFLDFILEPAKECGICFEEYSQAVICSRCNYRFCDKCNKEIEKHNINNEVRYKCPQCRMEFPSKIKNI